MKLSFVAIALLLFLGIAIAVLKISARGDKSLLPFLGQWQGQFTVERVGKGPDSEMDRKHHMLRGYVSIRLDHQKYLMHLEGEQQKVDVTGTWTVSDRQITLNPVDPKVSTEGGKGEVNPNFKYIPEEDLFLAYGKKITLKLSKDGSTLEGLRTTIAFLEGTHSFKKE